MIPFHIQTYETLPSTQTHALQAIESGDTAHGAVIHAHQQTDGHGRLGRTWQSLPNNLFLSLILTPTVPPQMWPQLSFVSALSAAQTCKDHTEKTRNVLIKWPNDILIDTHKAAGILVDVTNHYAVVGCGINVNTAPAQATHLGKHLDVCTVRDTFLLHFDALYTRWHDDGWDFIKEKWESFALPLGAEVTVTINGEKQTVTYNGITSDGYLKYIDTFSNEHIITTGDVILTQDKKG